MSSTTSAPETAVEPTRRDFLYIATAAAGGVAVAATIWPMIDQMNPDAAAIAAGAPVDIDLAQVQPGQQVTVVWRSKLVRRRFRGLMLWSSLLVSPAPTPILARNWSRLGAKERSSDATTQ